jgi:hypothetical protein
MQKPLLKESRLANGVLPDTGELYLIEAERKRLGLNRSEQARSTWDKGLPALHRTYIKACGSGEAGLDGGDGLGFGAVAGGAVLLPRALERLVASARMETGLALLLDLHGKFATVWAALSAAGIPRPRLSESLDRGTHVVRGRTRTGDMGAHLGFH